MYPRTSAIEANQLVNLIGGPYTSKNYRARARVVFQNKMSCASTAPSAIPSRARDRRTGRLAAMQIGIDPIEIRRRNLIPDDGYPCAAPSGCASNCCRITPH